MKLNPLDIDVYQLVTIFIKVIYDIRNLLCQICSFAHTINIIGPINLIKCTAFPTLSILKYTDSM